MKLRRSLVSLRNYRKSFFRKRYYPSEVTLQLLRDVYPKVDWKRVSFYEGLPWFTPPVAPYVTAQALPSFYSFGRFNIYLKRFDETRAQCLADILHEAFHVLQAMKFARGYGFGFTRGWMIYYLAEFLKHGYRNNAFEVPAYNQEFRFLSYCARLGIRGMLSQVHATTFRNISQQQDLVFAKYEYRYKGTFIRLVGAFLVCIAVTFIKPAADLCLYVLGTPFLVKRKIRSQGEPVSRTVEDSQIRIQDPVK